MKSRHVKHAKIKTGDSKPKSCNPSPRRITLLVEPYLTTNRTKEQKYLKWVGQCVQVTRYRLFVTQQNVQLSRH